MKAEHRQHRICFHVAGRLRLHVAQSHAGELVVNGDHVVQLMKRQQRGAARGGCGVYVGDGRPVRPVLVAAVNQGHRLRPVT